MSTTIGMVTVSPDPAEISEGATPTSTWACTGRAARARTSRLAAAASAIAPGPGTNEMTSRRISPGEARRIGSGRRFSWRTEPVPVGSVDSQEDLRRDPQRGLEIAQGPRRRELVHLQREL